MRSFVSALLALTIAAGGAGLSSTASAHPRDERDRYIEHFCSNHSDDRDCRDWRYNHRQWDDSRYQNWYHAHRDNNDDVAIAAIFGLTAGALIGSAEANGAPEPRYVETARDDEGWREHVRRCQAEFRVYDPRSNTYTAWNGEPRPCQL